MGITAVSNANQFSLEKPPSRSNQPNSAEPTTNQSFSSVFGDMATFEYSDYSGHHKDNGEKVEKLKLLPKKKEKCIDDFDIASDNNLLSEVLLNSRELINQPRQIPIEEIKTPRSIISLADLEKMVACIRTQAIPNAGNEITIELSESVLDGLKIRLLADKAGAIKAELVAATEASKFHIDARVPELAEMFRSRGIDIESLTTSIVVNEPRKDRESKQESNQGNQQQSSKHTHNVNQG